MIPFPIYAVTFTIVFNHVASTSLVNSTYSISDRNKIEISAKKKAHPRTG